MERSIGAWGWLVGLTALGACASDGGGGSDVAAADVDAAVDTSPVSDAFVYAQGCRLPPLPADGEIGFVDAFDGLTFDSPVHVTHAPDGRARMYVVEQPGRIRVVDTAAEPPTSAVFVDLTDRVACCGERGLLSVAFHPGYADNGRLFVNYTADDGGQGLRTVIAELARSDDDPDAADPTSLTVRLEVPQPYSNHNGGQIAFGPDGHLYVGMGDGGSAGDPLDSGQDTTTLLGAMLRLDVDDIPAGATYGIPADNPFASTDGPDRRELWAWGLRNPWRFSFDRVTGALWAGDVGQNAWEEIDLIEGGRNYGWRRMEGSHCYEPPADCGSGTPFTPPIAEYSHEVGVSVTGGFVYRGSLMPSWYEVYLYADYALGKVFALGPQRDPSDEPVATAPGLVTSFGEDAAGELYITSFEGGTGRVYRLVEQETAGLPADFPRTLSETGCFTDVPSLALIEGALPYEVNSPLWSDGAPKARAFVLPAGSRIGYSDDGRWALPGGTLLIKHFFWDTVGGDPSSRVPVETRLMTLQNGWVRGFSYRWDEAGTDAELLDDEATRELAWTDAEGAAQTLTWWFPGRDDCLACHTRASGGVLGLETAQLHRVGGEDPIDALAALELFVPPPGDQRVALADPRDDAAPLEDRARSYLHANCAHCHLPGGPSGVPLDLRYTTALSDMGACDVAPARDDLGLEDPRLLAPGDAERSLLYRRLVADPTHRMPPIGVSQPDDVGAAVLRDWIDGLDACPAAP